MDGFDHYNDTAEMAKKWNSSVVDAQFTTGRFGGQAFWFEQGNNALHVLSSNLSTFVVGFAYQYEVGASMSDNNLFSIYDDSTIQLDIYVNNDGSLSIRRGASTVLGTSAVGLVSPGVWNYIEFKATINNSGSYELRFNGTNILSDSGVDTQQSSNAYMNKFGFVAAGYTNRNIDDFYFLDTSGSTNNDFLGDVRIETIRPTGAGNQTDFTPSTGSNWENVDDTTPDDDSTYNYHAPQGLPGTDLFTMGDLTTISGSIFGIQPIIYTRKDDAGSADLYSVIRTGGTDYVGSGISLGDSYIYHTDILEENPNTATAWTVTDINNIEGGYRRTS